MQTVSPFSPPDPLQQAIQTLQMELVGLFQVNKVVPRRRGTIISFGGRLLHDPDASYDEIRRRFRAHGYTPLLRREKGEDVVLAMLGLIERSTTGNPLVNLLLLLATIVTTLAAGASMSGENLFRVLQAGELRPLIETVLAGAPFAIALLGILGIHELGHYLAAQLHRVRATLPYFIPLPFGGLGTLGAFIAIRSPMKDRRVLFDIGLAGPIAGFLAAVPLLIIGLLMSTNEVPIFARGLTLHSLGSSILVDFIVDLMTDVSPGRTLALHPIFFAAWLGFFLTGINLLPVGQLDGGHVSYALFGRFAHWLAIFTFAGLVLAGFLLSANWFLWAFFIMFGGLRHPPPLNDLTDIGWGRRLMGFFAYALFLLLVVPVPFPTSSFP